MKQPSTKGTVSFMSAIHEAGHAVVAHKLDRKIRYVTIRPKNNGGGGLVEFYVRHSPKRQQRFEEGKATLHDVLNHAVEIIEEIIISYAGINAEDIFLQRHKEDLQQMYTDDGIQELRDALDAGLGVISDTNNDGDLNIIAQLADVFAFCRTEEDFKSFVEEQFDQATEILLCHWQAVLDLALKLYKRKTLKGKEVYEIIENAMRDTVDECANDNPVQRIVDGLMSKL